MRKYIVNGKFLTQKMTGVQRFSIEIVKALDSIVQPGEIEIAIPKCMEVNIDLKNIKIRQTGKLKGILWEQISLPIFLILHGYVGINLGNVAPILKPDIVCIHDLLAVKYPGWFKMKYALWYKFIYFFIIRRAKQIITISKFSKSEIKGYFPMIKKEIKVISEGWQHIQFVPKDGTENVLKKFGLQEKKYIFSNYQLSPYKNFKWIIEVAKRNPNKQFVVTGWHNNKVSTMLLDGGDCPDNIKVLGYVSDNELNILITACCYFVFPSFYEGFGLPPIEALALGAQVIVSDIPVMHEILGDAVIYVNPYDYEINLDELQEVAIEKRDKVLENYSWERGADQLYKILFNEKEMVSI